MKPSNPLYSNCPICKNPTDEILTTKLRRGDGKVFFCIKCSHGFLKNKETEDTLRDFYSTEYRKEYSHKSETSETNPREIFEIYKNFQESRLSFVAPYLSKKKSLLEVGCSAGQFLFHIKNKLKIVNGIELDTSCCKFMEVEHKIDCDDQLLQHSRFKNNKYDLICSFQVMEHVPEPLTFLKNILNAANEKAALFIEVPNLYDPLIKIWDKKNYKNFYYHKAHLHYFTEKSLTNLAKMAGINKSAISFFYTQDYNLLNHLHWIMNDAPQETCDIGLGVIEFSGKSKKINTFLTDELKKLDKVYKKMLSDMKMTSNILMVIDLK